MNLIFNVLSAIIRLPDNYFFSSLSIAFAILVNVTFGQNLLAQEDTHQVLPVLDFNQVQILEGQSYCFTGFGAQSIVFKIDDKEIYSKSKNTPYLPATSLYEAPFMTIGCSFRNFFVDYTYFYDAIEFQREVSYNDSIYNTIEYKLNNLATGYSLTMIDHYLHIDFGIGYWQIQYELGYDNTPSNEELHDSGGFYLINLKLFLSAYFYVNWYNQQSFEKDAVVTYSNKLGLNFLMKL